MTQRYFLLYSSQPRESKDICFPFFEFLADFDKLNKVEKIDINGDGEK
jgi:hypothetical protein